MALEAAVLRTVIVRQMHPDDNPMVAHDLFEHLNTGSAQLGATKRAFARTLAASMI